MAQKPPRERAARALCRLNGVPEDANFEGRPMWESYRAEVDVVLQSALSPDQFKSLTNEG